MIQPNRVLDLGCGAGRNAIYLAQQGCSVVGVDISDHALQWAQKRMDEAEVNVDFICANIFELNLQEESFDFIYDSGCFHHIAPHRRVSYIELIHKLLKRDAYFALCSFEEHGAYGGSAISDEEVYIKRTLEGGLGYTKNKLKEIFQSLEEIEIRKMTAVSDEEQYFGLEGFLVGLFKKNQWGGKLVRKIKVQLSEYNPLWEQQYAVEQNGIGKALGGSAIHIEHIGSTSIKGLKAKPIIDILVGVQSLDEVPSFIDALSKIDYEYVPKLEFKDRRFFRKGLWGQGTIHLHICEYNSNEWNEKLLFRDYLRSHPQAANEYAVLKNQLASKYRFDRSTYTKEKEPFIQMIIQKAKM